jgi:AhpD family alkylhydroperoxidase
MKQRMRIDKADPGAFAAMLGLQEYVNNTPLNPTYKELIKIRASQINRCAYCIEMHTEHARKLGETESRIYALNAWRETPIFSDEERALLAMTEEVTNISNKGLSDETYQELQKFFDEATIMQALMQIAAINAWNRISIATNNIHPNHLKKEKVAAL